jgi:hypothetical protein
MPISLSMARLRQRHFTRDGGVVHDISAAFD